MNDTFLPAGTEIPAKEDRYMKFTKPENKFRVLGSAVVGFELWVSGKPLRRKTNSFDEKELQSSDIDTFTGQKRKPQFFWAFPVFNYQTEQVEILELRQVTIMRGIEDYLNDSDFGDPKAYDLNVIKDKPKDKVEYRVKASPPKKLDEGITQLYKDTYINLEVLFEGGNPFDETVNPESVKV